MHNFIFIPKEAQYWVCFQLNVTIYTLSKLPHLHFYQEFVLTRNIILNQSNKYHRHYI
jgi:hypothetical protein